MEEKEENAKPEGIVDFLKMIFTVFGIFCFVILVILYQFLKHMP